MCERYAYDKNAFPMVPTVKKTLQVRTGSEHRPRWKSEHSPLEYQAIDKLLTTALLHLSPTNSSPDGSFVPSSIHCIPLLLIARLPQRGTPHERFQGEDLILRSDPIIHFIPPTLQLVRDRPRKLLIPQPQPHQMPLLYIRIHKPIPRMEDG